MLRISPARRYHPPVSPGITDEEFAKLAAQPRAKDVAASTIEKQLSVESQAIAANLLHRGRTETLDLIDRVENPSTRQTIITYTVPQSHVLKVTHIAVWYSDPIIAMSRSVGWNVEVNNARVPRVQNLEDNQRYDSVADISHPMAVTPLWIQAGETITIDAIPLNSFSCALTMVAKIAGRLYEVNGPHAREV